MNIARSMAFTLAVVLGCGMARAQPSTVQHIQVGALDRTYITDAVHPERATGRVPVIIYLHGVGTLIGEGVPPRFDIPFTAVPDIVPFVMVRPQGVDRRWDSVPGNLKTWQRLAGTDGEPVDDIAFLRALIDQVIAKDNGDPTRVYVAGVSAGGYLVPRIACEMGDKVAAVADVIATARTAVFDDCTSRPVSFALMASTTDPTNPYAGLAGPKLSRLASAPETAAFFAKHDGCSTRSERALPHEFGDVPSTVSLVRFTGCADNTEVLFYRVDGSRHSVPSKAPVGPDGWNASGRRNRDIDTAGVLWAFFKTHQIAPAAQAASSELSALDEAMLRAEEVERRCVDLPEAMVRTGAVLPIMHHGDAARAEADRLVAIARRTFDADAAMRAIRAALARLPPTPEPAAVTAALDRFAARETALHATLHTLDPAQMEARGHEMEAALQHRPDRDDIHRLTDAMAAPELSAETALAARRGKVAVEFKDQGRPDQLRTMGDDVIAHEVDAMLARTRAGAEEDAEAPGLSSRWARQAAASWITAVLTDTPPADVSTLLGFYTSPAGHERRVAMVTAFAAAADAGARGMLITYLLQIKAAPPAKHG